MPDPAIPYNMYDDFENFLKIESELIKRNAIIIPHGSFVSYVGHANMTKLKAYKRCRRKNYVEKHDT